MRKYANQMTSARNVKTLQQKHHENMIQLRKNRQNSNVAQRDDLSIARNNDRQKQRDDLSIARNNDRQKQRDDVAKKQAEADIRDKEDEELYEFFNEYNIQQPRQQPRQQPQPVQQQIQEAQPIQQESDSVPSVIRGPGIQPKPFRFYTSPKTPPWDSIEMEKLSRKKTKKTKKRTLIPIPQSARQAKVREQRIAVAAEKEKKKIQPKSTKKQPTKEKRRTLIPIPQSARQAKVREQRITVAAEKEKKKLAKSKTKTTKKKRCLIGQRKNKTGECIGKVLPRCGKKTRRNKEGNCV